MKSMFYKPSLRKVVHTQGSSVRISQIRAENLE